VWLTVRPSYPDFGTNPPYICTVDEAMAFNQKVLPYMYNEPLVERYAAFGALESWASAGNGNALIDTTGHISALGVLYATTV
jgi:hypothetical protein